MEHYERNPMTLAAPGSPIDKILIKLPELMRERIDKLPKLAMNQL